MSRVETALKELIAAIIESPRYVEYEKQLNQMKKTPELKKQIDDFRQEAFDFQHSGESEELLDRLDDFTIRYEEFRADPRVEAFLSAELDFCRMIQHIDQQIVEAIEFE